MYICDRPVSIITKYNLYINLPCKQCRRDANESIGVSDMSSLEIGHVSLRNRVGVYS